MISEEQSLIKEFRDSMDELDKHRTKENVQRYSKASKAWTDYLHRVAIKMY